MCDLLSLVSLKLLLVLVDYDPVVVVVDFVTLNKVMHKLLFMKVHLQLSLRMGIVFISQFTLAAY